MSCVLNSRRDLVAFQEARPLINRGYKHETQNSKPPPITPKERRRHLVVALSDIFLPAAATTGWGVDGSGYKQV